VLDSARNKHIIRLASIDCPEIIHVYHSTRDISRLPGTENQMKNQAFGQAARQFTDSLVYSKQVKVRIVDHDNKYGRSIGYVMLGDVSVNEQLLTHGFAWHYQKYSRDPEYQQLEDAARARKLGLWKDPSPTPPWEFRRQNK
jgi:endonuclease YncB( thermonuclease family)